jgi:hypothetical protein
MAGLGACSFSSIPLSFEIANEISFPQQTAFVVGTMSLAGQLVATLLTVISEQLLEPSASEIENVSLNYVHEVKQWHSIQTFILFAACLLV